MSCQNVLLLPIYTWAKLCSLRCQKSDILLHFLTIEDAVGGCMDTTAVISFSLVPILTKCWYVQRLLKHAWTIAVLSSTQSTAACKANDPKTLVLEVFLWSNIHYSPESHLFCVSFCQFSIPHGKTPQDLRHGVCNKWGKWELVKLVQWNSDRSSWVSCCSWFVLAWSCQEFMQRDILGEEPEVQSCKPRAWSWAGGRLRLIEFHFLNPNFSDSSRPRVPAFLGWIFWQRCRQEKEQLEAWFSDSWKSSNLFGSPLLGQYVTNQSWGIL